MASIYKRRNCFWAKFRDPMERKELRMSLETSEEAEALCKLRKIDLLCELRRPEVMLTSLPEKLDELLRGQLPYQETAREAALPAASPATSGTQTPAGIQECLRAYITHIKAENAPATFANKLSVFRKFFGTAFVTRISGEAPKQKTQIQPAKFKGTYITEITAAAVEAFIETCGNSKKTRRHYRELFHHFFEFLLKRLMIEPRSWHTPNPMSALASYWEKNLQITYMNSEQIEAQLSALKDHPCLCMAVRTMIEAGLRRDETLWLTTDCISPGVEYFSVVNRSDDDETNSSLKTGPRSVTILPALRQHLKDYLSTINGPWLFPSPRNHRWHKDNFSQALRKLNSAAGIKWGPLVYRHTYATRRALIDGWGGVRIAREMGNSIQMVNKYYAGFIRPDAL